jgi:YHS domain-containing protein
MSKNKGIEMKFASLALLLFVLAACAHKKDPCCGETAKAEYKAQVFEFDNSCPMGLCRKGIKVKCDPEITLAHKGKNYCFSSLESRETFIKDLNGNLKKASLRWEKIANPGNR